MSPPRKPSAALPLLIYNLLFPLAFLAMLPGLARRMMRRGNYRRKFGQRFARYDEATRQRLAGGGWVWVHSISVGETLLALRLIRRMRSVRPDLRVVLSVTTSTGFALAEENAAEWLEPVYNPIDAWPLARHALETINPERLIFIEAVWPNLLAQAAARGIPTSLVARLSPRSERRFRRFRFLTAPIFRLLDAISVQEPGDIEIWKSLGAAEGQIHLTGNIKFDHPLRRDDRAVEFRALLERLCVPADSPVLLGGSTFPGEEGMLARICLRLRKSFPGLFLIIVPRHVERASEAAAEVTQAGLDFALRTAAADRDTPPGCLLVNTTGELRVWYELATVVFIGKSLSPTAKGGQNPVEPVFAGKPVLFGPHMENFRAVVSRLIDANAAIETPDEAALEAAIASLLRDPGRRTALAQRALGIVRAHEGAGEKTARLVLDGLGTPFSRMASELNPPPAA
jgi:3-deoxy-D-manno-octulosonic-acid transferase